MLYVYLVHTYIIVVYYLSGFFFYLHYFKLKNIKDQRPLKIIIIQVENMHYTCTPTRQHENYNKFPQAKQSWRHGES